MQSTWMHDNPHTPKALAMYNSPGLKQAMIDLSLALGDDPNLVNPDTFYQYNDNLICLQYLGKPVPDIMVKPS